MTMPKLGSEIVSFLIALRNVRMMDNAGCFGNMYKESCYQESKSDLPCCNVCRILNDEDFSTDGIEWIDNLLKGDQ